MESTRWGTWVSICWPVRRQSASECAARLHQTTRDLAEVDPVFRSWVVFSTRTPEPFDPTATAFERDFRAEPDSVIENDAVYRSLGFSSVFCTSGVRSEDRIRFHPHCGMYANVGLNGINIEIPPDHAFVRVPSRSSRLAGVLAVLARNWAPDWGTVRVEDLWNHRAEVPEYNGWHPNAAWLTYLSDSRGTVPVLPECFSVIPVAGKGSVIVATDDFFDPENAVHQGRVHELDEHFGRAGLLTPLPE